MQCAIVAIVVALAIIITNLTGVLKDSSIRASDNLYSIKPSTEKIIVIAIDDKSLQEIGRWPWDRKIHAEAINKLQVYKPKIIGVDISFFEKSSDIDDMLLSTAINNSETSIVLVSEFSQEKKYLKPAFSSTALTGHANLYTDNDGVVRSLPLQIDNVQSFSYTIASKISEKPIIAPLQTKISFYTNPEIVSYSDVLSNKTREEIFNNAIILIGVTAPDFHDDHTVPVQKSKRMPGVILHANAIQTILKEESLLYQQKVSVILYSILIIILTTILFWIFKPYAATSRAIIIIIGYILISLRQFKNNIIYDVLHPTLAGILTIIGCITALYFVETLHKKWVSEVLGKYVSKSVAKEVLTKTYAGEEITLTGKKKVITTLFADVRGFTTLSEKLRPEEVVKLLNIYLGDMTRKIFSEEGTIDKYLGDGIMAVWNSPIEQKDHAIKAVRAAIKMQESAEKTTRNLKRSITLNYGIGISTGPAIVGNMGSNERLEYTAIGDSVNTASRLCGIAKSKEILITEETQKLVKKYFKTEKIGKIEVKGKKKKLEVYKIIRKE